MRPQITDRLPPELVVYDGTHDCPYLDGRQARLPMRLPVRALSGRELDERLAEGDRRHGAFLYRPTCPSCTACQAIRLDAQNFPLRSSHKRVLKRGDRDLRMQIGDPIADDERLGLYEKHKVERGLVSGTGEPLDIRGYEGFLVDRCVRSVELRYYLGDELVALAVTDRGDRSLSAVYCFWDPAHKNLSLGTYSILKQVQLARSWGLRWVYLGLFIEDNDHMRYKKRFLPHQRLIEGRWEEFWA